MLINKNPSQAEARWSSLPEPSRMRRHCPVKTLADNSRLYSPAIARLTPLTMVEIGLPSLSNCSAQYSTAMPARRQIYS